MGSFLSWLFPNLSMALTRDSLLVSNRDVKATIRTFLYFEPTPSGPAVLSVGKEPSGPTYGESLCLFDHQRFDSVRAWALEAFFRHAIREVLPKNTLINPRVVVSGIGVLGPESDPARVRTLVNALVKAGAREVVVPELQGGRS